MERIDLILHPVRFRILECLIGESLTTQDIAGRLPDVPKSTIYRHLRLLLEADMIAVDETRPVRGVLEKTYRLVQPLHLGSEEIATLTPEEHIRYFRAYTMTLMQDFGHYVRATGGKVDMLADRAGYTQTFVFATTEELDQFYVTLNESLRPLLENRPGEGRRKRKLAIITHPD